MRLIGVAVGETIQTTGIVRAIRDSIKERIREPSLNGFSLNERSQEIVFFPFVIVVVVVVVNVVVVNIVVVNIVVNIVVVVIVVVVVLPQT